jgi:nucleotidyltransferase/DNA polymerase involved in DNA repair
VERLLALWVPSLAVSDEDGSRERTFLALYDEVACVCPFADAVRLGLITVPTRGPSRFFGGEDVVVAHLRETTERATGAPVAVGIADGLFSAFAAARAEVIVAPGRSEAFRRSLPISALERRQLATLCRRLGLHTVGAFADLDAARVAERFDRDAMHAHRVARGEESELAGQRDLRLGARLRALRGEETPRETQGGFFGDFLDADRRASAVANRVRLRLGPDGVTTAALRGGRSPEDRAVLVPFGAPVQSAPAPGPWPGRLPSPSPATALARPVALDLLGADGRAVRVDSRGALSAAPTRVVFDRGVAREVGWFAGPWPSVERWWSARRRRAYLQVLTEAAALLIYLERGRWWLAGVYD